MRSEKKEEIRTILLFWVISNSRPSSKKHMSFETKNFRPS